MKKSAAAAAGVMLNDPLTAEVNPLAEAVRVYPVPAKSILRVEKLATPAVAATVRVPESDAPVVPVFAVIATVTFPMNPVAGLPAPSSADTWIAGEMATPAVALCGCTVTSNWVADPDVMSKAALVAPVNPAAVAPSVYPVPDLSMLKFENVATPPKAATVGVPLRVPPPALCAIATVTLPLNVEFVFPRASVAVTFTDGLIVFPDVDVVGWTVKRSLVAVPAVIVNAPLVVPAIPVAAAVNR